MNEYKFPGIRLLNKIGEGGCSVVYCGVNISMNCKVAIKLPKPGNDELQNNNLSELLNKELEICGKLNHPNVVKLLYKGETSSRVPYGVFEYIRGVSLREYLVTKEALPLKNMGIIMLQVLNALSYIHSKGMIHGDLKPENIIICEEDDGLNIRLIDFGASSSVTEDTSDTIIASQCLKIGSPKYMFEDMWKDKSPTYKSDIFAWGIIFAEYIIGSRRFNYCSTISEILEYLREKISVKLELKSLLELLFLVLKSSDKISSRMINEKLKLISYPDISIILSDSEVKNDNTLML